MGAYTPALPAFLGGVGLLALACHGYCGLKAINEGNEAEEEYIASLIECNSTLKWDSLPGPGFPKKEKWPPYPCDGSIFSKLFWYLVPKNVETVFKQGFKNVCSWNCKCPNGKSVNFKEIYFTLEKPLSSCPKAEMDPQQCPK